MRMFALILIAASIVLPSAAQNTFPALLANGPDAKYKDKLQMFGQFVGSWTFNGSEFHDDGSHTTDQGEIHCRWVAERACGPGRVSGDYNPSHKCLSRMTQQARWSIPRKFSAYRS
jgi:hypothetical protein